MLREVIQIDYLNSLLMKVAASNFLDCPWRVAVVG